MDAGVHLKSNFHSTLLSNALLGFNVAPTYDGDRGISTMRPVGRELGKYVTSFADMRKILCPLCETILVCVSSPGISSHSTLLPS